MAPSLPVGKRNAQDKPGVQRVRRSNWAKTRRLGLAVLGLRLGLESSEGPRKLSGARVMD